jgi:hypothetical protein
MTLRIANARGVPGTAGPVVTDRAGARFVLANHHVLYGEGAVPGDRVWALPPEDGHGEHTVAYLGRARGGTIGRVTFRDEAVFVDCALIELASELPEWLAIGTNSERGVAAARPGLEVVKHGARTGTTHGVIADVAYPDRPYVEGRVWIAENQLLIESREPDLVFSGPGDSGAGITDELGRIVGLLWGSNANGQGIACPIEAVLHALEVSLDAGARESALFEPERRL